MNVIDMAAHKKPSERAREVQEFIKANSTEMGFMVKESERMFELYRNGKFDSTSGTPQERFNAKLILLDHEIDMRIQELIVFKERFANYIKINKRGVRGPVSGTTKNYGKKNGNTPTLKRQNLNGKGAKQKNLRSL